MSADCLAVTHAQSRALLPISGAERRARYSLRPEGLRGVRYVLLAGRLDAEHTLCRPIAVTASPDELGGYVASAAAFPVHGDGDSPEEAIADYGVCLADYFELVREGAEGGDPYDQAEYERLRSFITANG